MDKEVITKKNEKVKWRNTLKLYMKKRRNTNVPTLCLCLFFIACSASTLSVCLSTVGNCSVVVSLQKSERFICKMTQPLEITPKERQFDIYQCFFFQTGFLNFLKLRGDTRQTSAFIIRFFAMQPQREYYMYFLSFRNF